MMQLLKLKAGYKICESANILLCFALFFILFYIKNIDSKNGDDIMEV